MPKKYFGTDGIRGAINSKNINGDMFFKFGLASGTYFKSLKKKKQIAIIAKDTRLSGYTLEPALVSGLASAGTGDVLTGIIASLVSKGLNCYDAASVGTYIHGQTSDELVERKGYRGQLSSDLVEFLPLTISSYEKPKTSV